MRSMLALLAFVASAVSADAAGVVRRSRLLRHQERHQEPASEKVDAAVKDKTAVAKFGPANCISTFRNEDGHCELETQCKDQDISKYAVKFICIDAGGEKVRHVFASGSFDSEEQFDTLIECNKCLAEKQETIEIIADVPKKGAKVEVEKGSPIEALRAEVKDLEGFMMNTSAELEKLNEKVYGKEVKAPAAAPPAIASAPAAAKDVKAPAAAKDEKKASAVKLVHHGSVHHAHQEAQAARAREAHRRHLEEEDGEDVTPTPATKIAASTEAATASLAGAVRTAEERDEAVPAQQPSSSSMAMAAAPQAVAAPVKVLKPKPLVVALPKAKAKAEAVESADDVDGDDVDDSSAETVPQSADDFENQEAEDDDVPSMSALQKSVGSGSDDDDEDTGDDDVDTDDSEDASE